MIFVQSIPVILSLLVLAAHFSRHGQPVLMFVSIALTSLLMWSRPLAARLLQAVLLLAAAEWVHTVVTLARIRAEVGLPAGRMVVILGSVAAFTALSALVFLTPRMKRHFRIGRPGPASQTPS